MDSAQWVSRVEKSSLLQERMLLSELFQPQIMINALKQQTARTIRCSECTCSAYADVHESGSAAAGELKISMDQLHLICSFSKSKLPTSARVAASIDGLLLQGAMMVDGELTECSPDCSIFSPMPICYLAFVAHEEAKMFVGTGRVGVPLYVSN